MNKYSFLSSIGEGSFGKVYKATRKSDDSIVAIKIISKRGRSNKELKTLRRECEIQSTLKHANIVEMFESFETKHELVFVTEFAQTDLYRYLSKNGPMSEDKTQKLTGHLVSALYYLHSHRILHRDLKPQNVLLNDDLFAKLCDFGLARNMTMGTHVLTSIKGTPLYMAPELLSEKPYDHQADLWSLGCIIYETLSGAPPFCTTTILQLVTLIKHEEVKWPSFLSRDCISFLQGLLEKDSSLRITWTQILCHPFVENHLEILPEAVDSSPFINPKCKPYTKKGAQLLKSENSSERTENLSQDFSSLQIESNSDAVDMISSKDSIKAILQSDVENIETDAEDGQTLTVPFSDSITHEMNLNINTKLHSNKENSKVFVTGNSNLVVKHLNDNFKASTPHQEACNSKTLQHTKLLLNLKKTTASQVEKSSRNKDLEKRKLSQNLDNFSVRLGQTPESGSELNKKIAESVGEKKKISKSTTEDKSNMDNTPPCLLPGWDSCDESQSPPIENEEWFAFLHRSMQEVLDGELDSLREQNLVSIIVAPLRNSKASSKVIESVAELLSLPLVLGGPAAIIDSIKMVYIEVKLVPNLVYASKLLTTHRRITESTSLSIPTPVNRSFKSVNELSNEELKTISSLYELVCHLSHLNERFLSQFCDAIAILAADELMINFLLHDFSNSHATRTSNLVIALLCCIVRELPENAELVEKIVFNQSLDLVNLMKKRNSLLRSRICMLYRLLGRFSCRRLQNVWNSRIREAIEALIYDSNEQVRVEAESAVEELKQYSFYN